MIDFLDKFIDKIIAEILGGVYSDIKDRTQLIASLKLNLKKYFRNLKSDLDKLQVHRYNSQKVISDIFVESRLTEIILSERYIFDSNIVRNAPKPEVRTEDAKSEVDKSKSEIERARVQRMIIRNPKAYAQSQMELELIHKKKEDILKEYDRIIILGQPGSGKTTIVKKIIIDTINNKDIKLVPIYIPLRSLKLNELGIRKFIEDQFEKYGMANASKVVEFLFKRGKALIVLDGIDEIPKKEKRGILDQINELTGKFHDNRFICTTRIADYRGELNGFKEIEVCEFNDDDIILFIKKWFFNCAPTIKPKELLKKINQFPQIAEIASNPLLLSLICIVYEYDLEIASRRTTLYKRCVECLLRDWDSQRNFRRESEYSKLDDLKKINLLNQLAYCLHKDEKIYFSDLQIKEYLKGSIEKYGLEEDALDGVIEEIKTHYGFILEVSKDMFSFSHLTFQEYFSASYICFSNNWQKELDLNFNNTSWEEVFVLASSLFPDATDYIRYIFEKPSNTKRNLFLAGLCLCVDPIIDRNLKESIVRGILFEYHNNSNSSQQENLKYVIARIDDTFVGRKILDSLAVNKTYIESLRNKAIKK